MIARLLCGAASLVLLAAWPSATFAADPRGVGPGGEPPGADEILPMTPEQQASVSVRLRQVAQLSSSTQADGALTPDVCQGVECGGSAPYSHSLTVYARQQEKSYYCGPAVVQVVSNYTWGMASSSNKWTQSYISTNWTKTDANGQTYLGDEIYGFNRASKLPSGFVYAQLHNPSYSTWHNTVITDVWTWEMPLAAGVIPWKTGGQYHLISWKKVSNLGHYIELHGYEGYWNSSSPYVWYSDVAGRYAGTGAVAGNFKQNSNQVYQTMMYNNQNMIW